MRKYDLGDIRKIYSEELTKFLVDGYWIEKTTLNSNAEMHIMLLNNQGHKIEAVISSRFYYPHSENKHNTEVFRIVFTKYEESEVDGFYNPVETLYERSFYEASGRIVIRSRKSLVVDKPVKKPVEEIQ